jgi:hypothetical protein
MSKEKQRKIKKVIIEVDKLGNCSTEIRRTDHTKYVPLNQLREDTTKIVAIVAETVFDGRVKIPCGMAAAQAAHVVSKLKLKYLDIINTNNIDIAINGLLITEATPITTIVLKARDEKELRHISGLASDKDLLHTYFYDENESLYGNARVLTAVAIGPLSSGYFADTTDYLPLWKCGCESVLK